MGESELMDKTINDIVREVREGEGESVASKCGSCGWEINNPNWWDIAECYTGNTYAMLVNS
jgi:hypothetical protein